MAKYHLSTSEFDRKMKLECACGWSGTSNSCQSELDLEDLVYACPKCEDDLLVLSLDLEGIHEEVF